MDSSATSVDAQIGELQFDFTPLIRVYKDGRVERLLGTAVVPAGYDPQTRVESKDVQISSSVNVRLYQPPPGNTTVQKLPLLIYFHGGGFCIETASSPTYHNHLNLLASRANAVVVSIDYRRAPEFPLPTAYHDSWEGVQWACLPSVDPWLDNTKVDFTRVFFAGDSAGANIAHHMAIRSGIEGLPAGVNLAGVVLVHPFFAKKSPAGQYSHEKFWGFVWPGSTSRLDDPLINPSVDPNLNRLCCQKVLILVAEKDQLRNEGAEYKELLRRSGWGGEAEVVEALGEGHVFHLFNPSCENAVAMFNKLALFINSS